MDGAGHVLVEQGNGAAHRGDVDRDPGFIEYEYLSVYHHSLLGLLPLFRLGLF